jgi:hypothetical protein
MKADPSVHRFEGNFYRIALRCNPVIGATVADLYQVVVAR